MQSCTGSPSLATVCSETVQNYNGNEQKEAVQSYSCCNAPVIMWTKLKHLASYLWLRPTERNLQHHVPSQPTSPPHWVPAGLGPASHPTGSHTLLTPLPFDHLFFSVLLISFWKQRLDVWSSYTVEAAWLHPAWKWVSFHCGHSQNGNHIGEGEQAIVSPSLPM